LISLAVASLLFAAAEPALSDRILESPIRVERLANGARLMAVHLPAAKTVSAQLFISSEGLAPQIDKAGARHMLEHLVVAANDNLDAELESQGAFLTAATYRDVVRFEIVAGESQGVYAATKLFGLLQRHAFSEHDVKRERVTLQQELSLTASDRKERESAWFTAYGETRPDPAGIVEGMEKVTPEILSGLWTWLTEGSRVTLVVAGNLNAERTLESLRPKFQTLEPSRDIPFGDISPFEAKVSRSSAFVAGKIDEWGTPGHAARLATGLALGNLDSRVRIHYTPSAREGLVTLTFPDAEAWRSAKEFITSLTLVAPDQARRTAKQWYDRLMKNPSGCAYLHGMLVTPTTEVRPSAFESALQKVTPEVLQAEYDRWMSAETGKVMP